MNVKWKWKNVHSMIVVILWGSNTWSKKIHFIVLSPWDLTFVCNWRESRWLPASHCSSTAAASVRLHSCELLGSLNNWNHPCGRRVSCLRAHDVQVWEWEINALAHCYYGCVAVFALWRLSQWIQNRVKNYKITFILGVDPGKDCTLVDNGKGGANGFLPLVAKTPWVPLWGCR